MTSSLSKSGLDSKHLYYKAAASRNQHCATGLPFFGFLVFPRDPKHWEKLCSPSPALAINSAAGETSQVRLLRPLTSPLISPQEDGKGKDRKEKDPHRSSGSTERPRQTKITFFYPLLLLLPPFFQCEVKRNPRLEIEAKNLLKGDFLIFRLKNTEWVKSKPVILMLWGMRQ